MSCTTESDQSQQTHVPDDLPQSADVLLDASQPDDRLDVAETRNSVPQLDAIRGQAIPIILQNGLEAPEIPGRHRQVSFDADTATEASRMTVWDRGEALYSEAYPPSSVMPDVEIPSEPISVPLVKRLLTLRCKSPRPKGAFFFPRGSVEALITENEVAKVIAEGRRHLEEPLSDDNIRDYARDVCRTELSDGTELSYRKIFAILVMLDRGWEIVLFVDEGICDAHLPLKAVSVDGSGLPPKMRLESHPDTDLACLRNFGLMTHEYFAGFQWAMVSPFLARGKRRRAWFYQLSDRDVLPWTREELSVHQGGYGIISKVEIHPSHHNFKRTEMNAGMFAIKRFKANLHGRSTGTTDTENGSSASQVTPATLQAAWREFESEIEILNRFSGDVHPHLISLQAAFRHGDDHCVIFPWAEYDLKTLWKTKSFEPPLHKPNLEWVLEQCRGIASGLQSIHVYQPTESLDDDFIHPRNKSIYGRHGDIKPDNILLFRNQKDPNHRGRLVITDFGLTRFHSDGTKSYFTHKEITATLTYRPPECDMEGCTISRSFDIWSFGCVLLEFMAWYLGGWALVDKFVQDRKVFNTLLHGYNSDQFFEIVRPEGMINGPVYACVKHEVLKFVNEMHGHPHCSDPVHRLLDFIMEEMLVVESKEVHTRANCSRVYSVLNTLYNGVASPSFQLVATPQARVPVREPEAVELPLNTRARENAQPRFTQLREHTGSTRRLLGRYLNERSSGYSPRRTQTSPPHGG